MRERILEFLKKENKTSAQFAEEIGVQPSGISHILSGRNNPSLDFIIKMLEKFPILSTEWLLFGKGQMYKERFAGTLFNESEMNLFNNSTEKELENEKKDSKLQLIENETSDINPIRKSLNGLEIIKVIWFYNNNTFKEFIPHTE